MFKKLLFFCILSVITCNIFSITIKLKDQIIYGDLLLFKDNHYFIKADKDLYVIDRKIIKNLDKFEDNEMELLLERPSKKKINYFFFKNVIKMNKKYINGIYLTQKEKKQLVYPNIKLLPISFIAFALSYDYLKDANELQDNIDKLSDPPKSLKRKKTRLTSMGTIFLVSGIINTFISFNRIELYAEPNELWLSYKF